MGFELTDDEIIEHCKTMIAMIDRGASLSELSDQADIGNEIFARSKKAGVKPSAEGRRLGQILLDKGFEYVKAHLLKGWE